MPSTLQRQRRAQQRKPQGYRLLTGSWGLPTADVPDFGADAPPPEAAAAGQTVRIVKDVVRVGKFRLGMDAAGKPVYWDITPQTLAQIESNFRAMKAVGQRPNLGKTHGDDNLLIHPDDLIAEIDDVKVVGDTLWMSAYVTPEQAKYLQNTARKVSIGAFPNYSDAEGRRYPGDSMLHVAVTDRPAVNGQGPFLSLADEPGGGGSMNPDLLDAINMLMEAAGLSKLGEVADEADLISQLKGVSAALGKTVETTEEPPPEAGGELPPLDMSGVPAPLANTLKPLLAKVSAHYDGKLKALSDKLAEADREKAETVKNHFLSLCDAAVKEGAPKASVDQAKALAAKLGVYDPAMVAMIPRTLSTRSVAKTMADPNPPAGGEDKAAERKAMAERLAARRGISLEQAMAAMPA